MSDKKNEELEIETKDDIDDMSHDEFDVDEGANFKVEEKDQDHTQQEDHHSPLQDDQDPIQQKDHHSPPQDDQDLPQHEIKTILATTFLSHLTQLSIMRLMKIILMKIILQDTSYDDPFLYVCHSSRSHDEKNSPHPLEDKVTPPSRYGTCIL
jgi:hypothetical protein